jgi:DoxX-like protein
VIPPRLEDTLPVSNPSLKTSLASGTAQIACYPLAMQQHRGIYVEILIRGEIEDVWKHTQSPELHEPWDLRFTKIQYLPRTSEAEPQRFNYTTRIGFGLQISGEGESAGNREEATGRRTSALRFWSADPKSLIEEGSGYWQYIPTENGVRFLTWYDYQTRFRGIGRLLDTVLFRPLLGWATAWSFDRLRLQIDRGLEPKVALRLSVIHACSRFAIAIIWLWQGLLPKLLFNDADERAMIAASHLSTALVPMMGLIEIAIAACAILSWRRRSFFLLNIVAMVVALANVAITSPSYLVAAFNPVTLNLAMIALSLVGYIAAAEIPSASRCLRQPPKESA